MSSTISGIGSSSTMMMGMARLSRPDPSKMTEDLFSQIDTSGRGYIERSDLTTAFSQVSTSDTTAEELFSSLDSDNDGKVTQEEFSSGIQKLSQALDSQFESMRMSEAMGGMGAMSGMPPPPPSENDTGFTQEELEAQLAEIGDTDSERSSFISNIVDNFSAADTDGDGKVTFQEAMAYNQSSSAGSSTTSTGSSSSTDSSATVSDAQLMLKILQLMHAYSNSGTTATSSVVETA